LGPKLDKHAPDLEVPGWDAPLISNGYSVIKIRCSPDPVRLPLNTNATP
jgi:hypothetical protein